uniref:Thioredoxin domain-containing protein n=2 Tax=Eukaryota TaxID=2759 RepID=A0A7S1X617_9CHLO|mmetsp:Transcript_31972/g.57255  ORF Transcript_31972/g.57255 Transcript_31972/m.57255 type:complete len:200 (+) Transcript_31972:210-809(+)
MATTVLSSACSRPSGGLTKSLQRGSDRSSWATSLRVPFGAPPLRRKPAVLNMRSRTSAALVSWFQNPFGDSKETAGDAETDSVERLTAERWPDFVSSAGDNLCVVDYYTKWCGPCKIVLTELSKMALKHNHVRFGKYDCEELGNEDLASELNVHELPTVIMYRGGAELKRFTGVARLGEVMGMVELWDEKAQNGSLPPC